MTTSSDTAPSDLPVQIIRPSGKWGSLSFRELWQFRELLFVFTKRNVLVRYKQTVLGAAWAIIQPVFMMIVFTIFFRKLAHVSSGGVPYPIFSYSGLLPWLFFSNSMVQSSGSLVANANMLRKIYLPRLILPLTSVLTALVDFFVASSVLAGLMIYFHVYPAPIRLLALPLLVVLAMSTALGVGLWLSSLNVKYRDVGYVVPFLTQIWMFATPAIYLAGSFHEPWKTVLGLNPMQGVVGGFRWALLHQGQSPGPMLGVSVAISLFMLVTGLLYFRRTERTFADVV